MQDITNKLYQSISVYPVSLDMFQILLQDLNKLILVEVHDGTTTGDKPIIPCLFTGVKEPDTKDEIKLNNKLHYINYFNNIIKYYFDIYNKCY